MVEWQVVGSSGADPHVIAWFYEQDGGCWRRFVDAACGVPSPVRSGATLCASGALESERNTRRRSLSLTEAYHALAVDRLLDGLQSMDHYWNWFSELSADFRMQFAVYQHFRRLGWRVKSGLNYGAHFVLYRGPATKCHSEYIVYIQGPGASSASWNVVQALTRVAADVKKTVLLCETTASAELSGARARASSLTQGSYEFHGLWFTVDAVALRFWDVGDPRLHAADASADAFAFASQPTLRKSASNKAARKQRQDTSATGEARKKPRETGTSAASR